MSCRGLTPLCGSRLPDALPSGARGGAQHATPYAGKINPLEAADMPTNNMASVKPPIPQSSPTPVLFCWSGGKDSALALHALRQRAEVRVTGLLTTVTEGYDRISMHGVRRSLLLRQAEAVGLPCYEVRIPPQCVNPVYESRMQQALCAQLAAGVRI